MHAATTMPTRARTPTTAPIMMGVVAAEASGMGVGAGVGGDDGGIARGGVGSGGAGDGGKSGVER